jgi:hypothetical protein
MGSESPTNVSQFCFSRRTFYGHLFHICSQEGIVGIVKRPRDGQFGVRTPDIAKDFFSFSLKRPDCLWGPPSLIQPAPGRFFPEARRQSSWGVCLTSLLRLVLMLRMNGPTPSLPLYPFMACIGTIFIQDFRLPQWCNRGPHSSGMLCSVRL